ncbi:MAG: hypothetical protein IT308_05205 [Anaerolineaceae bacterium]|nr:hypothetical protein [Anaerolineaceae bacterium]
MGIFDLYLLTFNISSGQEQSSLPGLWAAAASRGCERSRAADLLLAYFSLGSGVLPADEQIEALLKKCAETYFSARGSVTAGLRSAIEELNNLLLKDNLQKASQGAPLTAALNLAVIRRENLYLAQAGQTHVILLSADEVTFFKPDSAPGSRALGVGRNVSVQFSQAALHAKDLLLLSPAPPENWNAATLTGSPQLTFEQLRRRLLSQSGENLQAVVVQFQAGKGAIHRLKPRLVPVAPQTIEPEKTPEPAALPDELEMQPPSPPPFDPAMGTEGAAASVLAETPFSAAPPDRLERDESLAQTQPDTEPVETVGSVSFVPPHPPVVKEATPFDASTEPAAGSEGIYIGGSQSAPRRRPAPGGVSSPSASRTGQTSSRPQRYGGEPTPGRIPARAAARASGQPGADILIRKKIASGWFQGKATLEKIQTRIKTFTSRLMPASSASRSAGLPPSTLLFIAVAVPLVIVAIATTIYSRSGWKEPHYLYLQEAQKYANQAMAQNDPALQETLWKQSETWLEKAEGYGKTDESRTLRSQVQQSIDRLEGVQRLLLLPALLTPFPANVNITDIVVADNGDLYLLNQTDGRILRMFMTAQGYEVDAAFKCGPGVVGALQIGPVVDVVALEFSNKYNASILAADAHGHLLYCVPGDEPFARELPKTDREGWSNITAIARDIQADSLYVADTGLKQIVYFDGERGIYDTEAHNAFDNYIPSTLDQTVDIAFNEDLFILYANSRVGWCTQRNYTYSTVDCKDPAAFGDARPNRASDVVLFPDAKFIKLLASEPPDPALYIVEQGESSIYLFSLKLNLQYLLRPQFEDGSITPKRPMSAFAIAPGRTGILAFGNEIYTTVLP